MDVTDKDVTHIPRRQRTRFARLHLTVVANHKPHSGVLAWSLRGRALKRLLDVVLAGALLLAALPVILVAGLAVMIDSPGPMFYRSLRVGRHGRKFWMWKLRKMQHRASGPPLTTADDPRLTRVGRVISRLKIDELPQLWNVLVGDMSLVGPRPQTPGFVAAHAADYAAILAAKPGITGLSQLAFAEEDRVLAAADPFAQYAQRILPQKFRLDRMYLRNWSLALDLRILFWTAVTVLLRIPVAVDRKSGAMRVRRRPRKTARRAPERPVGAKSRAVESSAVPASAVAAEEAAA